MTAPQTLTLAQFITDRIAEDEDEANHAEQELTPYGAWTPTRVLAECESKRKLLAWYGDGEDVGDGGQFLQLLALPYADRPGFREEWRA